MTNDTGSQIDVLDLVADRHRSVQQRLRDLAEAATPVVGELDRLAEELLCDEGLKRVTLHPLLARADDGEQAVGRRRDEQHLLVHQLARALAVEAGRATGTESADGMDGVDVSEVEELSSALHEVYRTAIGHMDREELEDFPKLRACSTQRERDGLAAVQQRLRGVCQPLAQHAVRTIRVTDPLAMMEAELHREMVRPRGRS